MDEGRLTYTKAREFVALATPENEAEWIEFAITHTNRDLEREVARKRRGTPEETREVTSRVTPAEAQAVRQARECLMKLTDRPVPADKVLPLLAETALGRGLFEGGNGVSADAPPVKPYLTIALDPFTFHTWVPTPEGDLDVPILDWVRALRDGAPVEEFVTKYFCDCEDEIHRRDLCPHYRPSDGPAPTSRHVPVEVRRRIEARDGSRCRVPGCLNAGPLEIGHFRPHRDGGPMTEENLGKQCEACNKMIESKTLKVEGEAPFERYHRWDDSFLGYGCDHRPFPHVGQDGLPVGLAPGDPPEGHEPHA